MDIALASDKDTDDVCQLLAKASTTPFYPPVNKLIRTPLYLNRTALLLIKTPPPPLKRTALLVRTLSKRDSPAPVSEHYPP